MLNKETYMKKILFVGITLVAIAQSSVYAGKAGVGIGAGLAGFAIGRMSAPQAQPQYVERQIVVDRPVPVQTNQQRIRDLEQKVRDLEKDLDAAYDDLDDAKVQLQELKQERRTLKEEKNRLQQEVNRLKKELPTAAVSDKKEEATSGIKAQL